MVGGMAASPWRLKGGWESGCSWADLQGGTYHPQAGQAVFVRKEELEWGEAGFNTQDVSRGARKAVCVPSLDLVPEG